MVSRSELTDIKIKTKTVNIPDLGDVVVRELWSGDVQAAQKSRADEFGQGLAMLALSLCDDNGDAMFGIEDVEQIEQLPMRVLQPLLEAMNEVNGLETVEGN